MQMVQEKGIESMVSKDIQQISKTERRFSDNVCESPIDFSINKVTT